MKPNEFAIEMRKIIDSEQDTEERHIASDNLMCKLLIALGYQEGVAIYNSDTKWYA